MNNDCSKDFAQMPEGPLKDGLIQLAKCFYETNGSFEWRYVDGVTLLGIHKEKAHDLVAAVKEYVGL